MSIDLSKLSPAPWVAIFHGMVDATRPWRIQAANGDTVAWFMDGEEAKSAALARNAFDVQMRRGWRPVPYFPENGWDRWTVSGEGTASISERFPIWPDPFTALVQADKLYREHVEKTPEASP